MKSSEHPIVHRARPAIRVLDARHDANRANRLLLLALGALLLLGAAAAHAESAVCAGLPAPRPLVGKAEAGSACDYFKDRKAVLVVNTASKCGFTGQFKGLEALYKKYQGQGLQVLGFPSDDFAGQEYDDAEQTAKVCYRNYGVSFPMFTQIDVRGAGADPLFQRLRAASGASPAWNFHKYLVVGDQVLSFGSTVDPEDKKLVAAIEQALARPLARLATP